MFTIPSSVLFLLYTIPTNGMLFLPHDSIIPLKFFWLAIIFLSQWCIYGYGYYWLWQEKLRISTLLFSFSCNMEFQITIYVACALFECMNFLSLNCSTKCYINSSPFFHHCF
jgi:hypothetical protein